MCKVKRQALKLAFFYVRRAERKLPGRKFSIGLVRGMVISVVRF